MIPATIESLVPSRRANPKRTRAGLMLLMCGLATLSAAGAASAAASDADVPSVALRFDPQSLETDQGARVLYRRIVYAAALVCPDMVGRPWISPEVRRCREESVARAVRAINNPRLVAVYASSAKHG